MLLLGELPQQASAQQVLLLGRGRGNFLAFAVERAKQGPGLGQVPCHGLPGRGRETPFQLGLEGLVLAQGLAQSLGLANPLGVALLAKILGFEYSVEHLPRLVQQRLRRLKMLERGLGISLVNGLAQGFERLECLADRVIGIASIFIESEPRLAQVGHLLPECRQCRRYPAAFRVPVEDLVHAIPERQARSWALSRVCLAPIGSGVRIALAWAAWAAMPSISGL